MTVTTMRGAFVAGAAVALIGSSSASALAAPDLRQPRTAGPLTVYPDDARANVFYYPPGELAIAIGSDGAPDVHLLHARYTGSASTGDRGVALVRSIFTVRVTMDGPHLPDLAAARRALAADGRSIELRPLPIRRVESAIVYAPAGPVPAAEGAAGTETEPQPLPDGHFESSTAAAAPQNGYWTERVYTLGLPPGDAQLLSSALERGSVALSVGYAFLADGIAPDPPLQAISGSPALVRALRKALPAPTKQEGPGAQSSGPHVVRAGAVGITADLARWPHMLRRVDINDSAPPGYAALDVYCYDFNQGAHSSLYEKAVEIEADGVGGRKVTLSTRFSRAHPDLYAAGLRFPVAVRLDRPYRFRVHETRDDGTSKSGAWQERQSWAELLDVTDQGDDR